MIDGKRFVEESGEVQLTDYGISGIPVFQLSSYAIRALDEGKKVTLSVNFLPEYTKASLKEYLKKGRKSVHISQLQSCFWDCCLIN